MLKPSGDSQDPPELTPAGIPATLMPISSIDCLAAEPSDPSVCSERSDSYRDLEGLEAAKGASGWHLPPTSVEALADAPSDPSVPSERGESDRDTEGLERQKSEHHGSPPSGFSNNNHGTSDIDKKNLRSLQHTLTGHRLELQSYLEDWSQRQNQIIHSVLVAPELATPPRTGISNLDTCKKEHSRDQLLTENGKVKTSEGGASKVSKLFSSRTTDARRSCGSQQTMATVFTSYSSSKSQGNGTKRGSRLARVARESRIGQFYQKGVLQSIIGSGTKNAAFTTNKRTRTATLTEQHGGFLRCYTWAHQHYVEGKEFMQDKTQQGILARFVLGNWFEALCAIIILANSICLGYSSDYAMHNLQAPSTQTMDSLELAFTIFYSLELVLRVVVLHWCFIFTDDWKWNMFDLILVASAVYDQISSRMDNSYGGNTSVLRIMRLTKMMKLLRIFRILRMFRELRLILNSIVGSMRSMIWSVLLIIIITYVIGIVFLQAGTVMLMEGTSTSTMAGIYKYWGSLLDSMHSLYVSTTGGVDWVEVARTLEPMGPIYYMLFLLYIAFFLFVVMNTLTSLFVETAMKNAEQDHHNVIQDEMKRKNEYISKIRRLYERIAKGQRAELTQADFEKVLQDSEMLAFMQSVEIDTMDCEQFFNILSCGGTQGVDIETFVVGCMKLRGMARSMDLMAVAYTQRQDSAKIRQIETQLLGMKDLVQLHLSRSPKRHFSHELKRAPSEGRSSREASVGFQAVKAEDHILGN
mmetsp:Transcript_138944/g.245223  ORF Transcript_138944/g.245223 Transcript_138944/m.245223 type:complete len:753 (-) Transcript_138944:36-2294(-)